MKHEAYPEPKLFYVVEKDSEGNFENISVGIEHFKEALSFLNGEWCKKHYPNAFIVGRY